jgi:hypothetical protein
MDFNRIVKELRGIVLTLLMVAVTAGAMYFLVWRQPGIPHTSLVLLVPIIVAAIYWGLLPALAGCIAAIVASLIFLDDPYEIINLAAFGFVVAAEHSRLSSQLKRQIEIARQQRRAMSQLAAACGAVAAKLARNKISPAARELIDIYVDKRLGEQSKGPDELESSLHQIGAVAKRVLFIGPASFRKGIWDTRAKYIFPDLLNEIGDSAELYMLTTPVPDWAEDSFRELCETYRINHLVVETPQVGENYNWWLTEALLTARKVRPDVVTNIFGGTLFGYCQGMMTSLLGITSVIRVAGDEIGSREAIGVYKKDQQKIDLFYQATGYASASRIIVMSDWERQRVCSFLEPGQHDKVMICQRGIDLLKFSGMARSYEHGPRNFLFVGRKSLEKGYDIAEATAKLIYEHDKDISFRFAGSFDPGEIDNRRYLGFVQSEDLPQLYQDNDAFIMTSRTEGWPQALSEAMAMGLPCIVPAHIFWSVLRDGEDALLVENDPAKVAEAIERLAGDPELAMRLSRNALAFAENSLDRQKWIGKYRQILLGETA